MGRRRLMAALFVAVGALTGCASTVDGSGTAVTSSTPPPKKPTTPTATSCDGAAYCETFTGSAPGWPSDSQPHFYADYSSTFGGTYHMGERFDAVISEDAPKKISAIAPDYGVRADVDATLSPSMTPGTGAGMTCWEHATTDGKAYSAFIFEITNSSAELYLWRDTDGKYVSLQKDPTTALRTTGVNHLSITCAEEPSGSGPQATLAMSVNGQEVLRAVYGTGGGSSPWKVGDGAGIIASGRGSDIFYDNFALRSLSAPAPSPTPSATES